MSQQNNDQNVPAKKKVIRCLGNLRSSAAYINFLTPFPAAYNRISMLSENLGFCGDLSVNDQIFLMVKKE